MAARTVRFAMRCCAHSPSAGRGRERHRLTGGRVWPIERVMNRLFVATLATAALAGCGATQNHGCNGHPCIGNWQKEKAEGGTVVQCNDGAWSYAGGIQGACSGHGGEKGGGDNHPFG